MESILLWGSNMDDTQDGNKKDREAFETWLQRRTLRISWSEKVKNEEIYLKK